MESIDLEIPAPGAPLLPDVHPRNQALMQQEIARRVELARAKLTRRQLAVIKREHSRLHARLSKAHYWQLRERYAAALQEYREIELLYKANPDPDLKERGIALRADLRELSARLTPLSSLAQDWNRARRRLEAHEAALRIEREDKENREQFYKEADVWERQIKAVFKQSPRLHHFTKDKRGNDVIITPVIERIILKPDKVYFQIQTMKQGLIDRLAGAWQSALPYGVDVKNLISDDTLENLTAACGRVVTVERGQRSQNLFYVISRLDSADGIPRMVRLAQVADHYPADRHRNTPWCAGMGEDRKLTHFDFEQYPNVLVAGAAGGGKSNLINAILCQLITLNSPDELRLFLIDNKGGVELSHFEDIPHLLAPPVIHESGVLPALQTLTEIIRQRYALFLAVKAKKLVEYNAKIREPLPRLIVVIDELATLLGLGEVTQAIHAELRTISSLGRAAGVHLILSTQHPSVDVLPGWIKTNLTLRVAFRMPNHVASQIIVDSITAAALPEVPGRAVFRRGGFEVLLQTPFTDDQAIAHAVAVARQYAPAQWQVTADRESGAIVAPPPPRAIPVFGEAEYLRLAVEIGGSLSARKIYDSGAKKHGATQADCDRLYQHIVYTYKDVCISIDGASYEITTQKGGGHKLRLVLPTEPETTDTPETSNLATTEPKHEELYEPEPSELAADAA